VVRPAHKGAWLLERVIDGDLEIVEPGADDDWELKLVDLRVSKAADRLTAMFDDGDVR
jgi:hypothetical protein